jgi:hypothetical protein
MPHGEVLMSRKISVSEEIYTHEYLWRAANLMLEEAKLNEERSIYFFLTANLMFYLSFEAFINFCGYILFPEIWQDEKNNFKGKGDVIESKISKLIEAVTDFEWKKGERPYQSIKNLKYFRDIVAHGKVETSHYDVILKKDGSHIKWIHDWDDFISIEKVESFGNDIQSFCQSLLESMRKKSDHPHLIFNAFEGSLASAEGGPVEK